jgi:tripartite motif-containing protein 71
MVIVDRHGARLVVLDAEGRIEGLGSRRGRDPGLLLFPAGITALPDGRLAVADQGNGRIQIFHRIKEESVP